MTRTLQWGGRFSASPDPDLIAFGSSLEEDLVLAEFDLACSHAHVDGLLGGRIISDLTAANLHHALERVAQELASGAFAGYARSIGAEDVHGAIDRRVRDLSEDSGKMLHAARSRNDQVATTLLLYARERSATAQTSSVAIAGALLERAELELEIGTMLAATTHWQPAQPILLAFWLAAGAQMFTRAARRFARVADEARRSCPLGSGAVAGSTLPLDREAAARALGFSAPSINALDAIGNRDAGLDLLHAMTRGLVDASRLSEELVLWCTPAFGYVTVGDAASTGSSLMPQKRNPDPFELVRSSASELIGTLTAALGTLAGLGLSYHRDLQTTKGLIVRGTERGIAVLDAFARAFAAVTFNSAAMSDRASDGFTIATDLADALIGRGVDPAAAHSLVGQSVKKADEQRRAIDSSDLEALGQAAALDLLIAPLTARESIESKRTAGSTHPDAVRDCIRSLRAELSELAARC